MTPNAWLSGDVHQSELVKFPTSESPCVLWGCSRSSNALEVIVVFGAMATKPLVLGAIEDRLRAERSFSVHHFLLKTTSWQRKDGTRGSKDSSCVSKLGELIQKYVGLVPRVKIPTVFYSDPTSLQRTVPSLKEFIIRADESDTYKSVIPGSL